jgi:hypothetical protein
MKYETKKKLLRRLAFVPVCILWAWIVLNAYYCQNRPIVPDLTLGRQYATPCKGPEVFLSFGDLLLQIGLPVVSFLIFGLLLAKYRSLGRNDGFLRLDDEEE